MAAPSKWLIKRQCSGRGPVCAGGQTPMFSPCLLQLLLLSRCASPWNHRPAGGRQGDRGNHTGSGLFGFWWSRWRRTESRSFYLKHPSLSPLPGPQQLTLAQPMGFIGHEVMNQSELRCCGETTGGGGLLTWRNALDSPNDSLMSLFIFLFMFRLQTETETSDS